MFGNQERSIGLKRQEYKICSRWHAVPVDRSIGLMKNVQKSIKIAMDYESSKILLTWLAA